MEWLTDNSGIIVTVLFFTFFSGIAIWAYMPSNKRNLQEQANILFHEEQNNG